MVSCIRESLNCCKCLASNLYIRSLYGKSWLGLSTFVKVTVAPGILWVGMLWTWGKIRVLDSQSMRQFCIESGGVKGPWLGCYDEAETRQDSSRFASA
jgi:hypothetical protein